jgi:hypothetical protein
MRLLQSIQARLNQTKKSQKFRDYSKDTGSFSSCSGLV